MVLLGLFAGAFVVEIYYEARYGISSAKTRRVMQEIRQGGRRAPAHLQLPAQNQETLQGRVIDAPEAIVSR